MKNLIALFIIVWTIVVSIEWYPKCGVVLGILFPITIGVGAIYILYFIKKWNISSYRKYDDRNVWRVEEVYTGIDETTPPPPLTLHPIPYLPFLIINYC